MNMMTTGPLSGSPAHAAPGGVLATPPAPRKRSTARKSPIERFYAMIDLFERNEVEAAVDALIARLDADDGDPDLEDGHDAEAYQGDETDGAWIEWHLRPNHRAAAEPIGLTGYGAGEDDEDGDEDEDDDPAGGNITDEPHDAEPDAEPDNPVARHPFTARIRREACDVERLVGWGWQDTRYRLRYRGRDGAVL